jgi:segregation and condensation protein B
VLGRPILYRTSKEFMMRFGLSDLDELPSLKEFEQLARDALGTDEGLAPAEFEPGAEAAAAAPDVSEGTGLNESSESEPSSEESSPGAVPSATDESH